MAVLRSPGSPLTIAKNIDGETQMDEQARPPQDYYDRIKDKFAEERDLRLGYRPEGTAQYTSDLEGALAKYAIDPYAHDNTQRAPINDWYVAAGIFSPKRRGVPGDFQKVADQANKAAWVFTQCVCRAR